MSNVDTRQLSRDSLFVMAKLKIEGALDEAEHRVKVRNISSGGLMAEGDVKVVRGTRVSLELRNIGWVEGQVAWKQDNRFGVAFTDEIDPKRVRASSSSNGEETGTPRYVRPPLRDHTPDASKLRKI